MKYDKSLIDSEKIISLEYCPGGGFHCHDLLSTMNDLLSIANHFLESKEFEKAIIQKMKAFDETYSLKKSGCQNCGIMFRERIYQSLQADIEELKKMSSGPFGKKRFLPILEEAKKTESKMKSGLRISLSSASIKNRKLG